MLGSAASPGGEMALAFVLKADGGEPKAQSDAGGGLRPVDSVHSPTYAERPKAAFDVLVVDDDDAVRSSSADILRDAGYAVAEATDGHEALQLLQTLEIGMVLLDIRMPGMDGIALLEALENHPPVVICSAFSLDAEAQRRVAGKVALQLQKPVDPSRLLKVVADTLSVSD